LAADDDENSPIEAKRGVAAAALADSVTVVFVAQIAPDMADIAMARNWYQKARDLGSTEAAGRLERLAGRDDQAAPPTSPHPRPDSPYAARPQSVNSR
jgi:hypothetical protein